MTTFDTHYLDDPRELRLKNGEDSTLEEQARVLLTKSRQGITALSEKRDWLSDDQLKLRYDREVMNHNGIPDESLMSGLFRRAYNPLANSRPTKWMHHHEEY